MLWKHTDALNQKCAPPARGVDDRRIGNYDYRFIGIFIWMEH